MIVEVTGPSGSGKTSFIHSLLNELEKKGCKTGAIHSSIMNRCTEIPIIFSELDKQNFQTDIAAFRWSLLFFIKHPAFYCFCILNIIALREDMGNKTLIARSFLRKSGIFEFLQQKKFKDVIILVDEGLIHSSHNLLVSVESNIDKRKVKKFADLCPSSDMLIFLNAPLNVLMSRLQKKKKIYHRV